ncbi:MAG: hypothetical protein KTR16_00300 [Acidiferrobacterales bacterium]|nr:hypothetical protein [Acidiferrobacterales bacterium]
MTIETVFKTSALIAALSCVFLSAQAAETSSVKEYLTRDVRDDVFYFVMPDRFNNGLSDNDQGSDKYAISRGGLDKKSKWAFHGGDVVGLERKLDYLAGMGVTAIWMTPILRNKAVQKDGFGHHGYWTVDFTQLDPHFGTNEELKGLIDAAHAKGIKVFFDIITNHTADVIKFRECHNDDGSFKTGLKNCEYKSLAQVKAGDQYTPFVPEAEQGEKYPEWLNDPQYYHNQGDSTFKGESSILGDFAGLDDLNTKHPKVLSGMIEIYQNLIKEFKPDGFRVDTVKHVQLEFWQEFTPAIVDFAKKQGIPNFHVFGEVYDPDPKVLSVFTTQGKVPSVLDFGFQSAAADVFFAGKSPLLIKELFAQDHLYKDHDSDADTLMTFLGNHDMGRPGMFINQHPNVANMSDEEKLQRSILAHAFMYFSRGIPVVYYGDEQGFTGDGNDVDAREDMFPSQVASYNDNDLIGTNATTADNNFDTSHPIYQALKSFASLRLSKTALKRGVFKPVFFTEDSPLFVFSRYDAQANEEVMVAINSGTSAASTILNKPAPMSKIAGQGSVEHKGEEIAVSVPALSYVLLKVEK